MITRSRSEFQLEMGLTLEDLLGQYSQLTREDIQAALYYAADAARSSLVA